MPDDRRAARRVKLFQNGRNQAVRIPREFELPGEDALMRKEASRLIIEPVPAQSLIALLATFAPLDDDFAEITELPLDEVSRIRAESPRSGRAPATRGGRCRCMHERDRRSRALVWRPKARISATDRAA